MKLFEEISLFKKISFWISCLFVYAGAVNYGGFDFLPAIPFLVFVVLAAFAWKKIYLVAVVMLALICAPLYYLKKQHGDLFHPNIGREFSFIQDVCLTQYKYQNDIYVLLSEIQSNSPCDSSNISGAIKWEILPKGTKLVVKKIVVSNADLGESYVIHADTHLGDLSLFGSQLAVWADGRPIAQSDLRRAIFYVPSLLMYWPAIPILLLTVFNK